LLNWAKDLFLWYRIATHIICSSYLAITSTYNNIYSMYIGIEYYNKIIIFIYIVCDDMQLVG